MISVYPAERASESSRVIAPQIGIHIQENRVQVLFVHGMGRSPLSGSVLIWKLWRAGLTTRTFGYAASLEDFPRISDRLVAAISRLAERGDYVLVGHSLGGVLLRAAINALPEGTRLPRLLFLLGSPVRPSRLAQRFGTHLLFRLVTRDCGRLLASTSRMSAIGAVAVPTTCIAGIAGFSGTRSYFASELNDGVVSLSEVTADWAVEHVHVPVFHTLMPSSPRVAELVLERILKTGA
jgi:pimeloyl-ACP methyl ester carboxylesterase